MLKRYNKFREIQCAFSLIALQAICTNHKFTTTIFSMHSKNMMVKFINICSETIADFV